MRFKNDRQRKAVMAQLRMMGHDVIYCPVVSYKYSPLTGSDMTKPEGRKDALSIKLKGRNQWQTIALGNNDSWDAWYNRNRFVIRGDYKDVNITMKEDIKIDAAANKISKEAVLNKIRTYQISDEVRYILDKLAVRHPESNKIEDYGKRALVAAIYIVERENKFKVKIL